MKNRGGQPGNDNPAKGKSVRDAINHKLAEIGRNIPGDEAALKKGMRAIVGPQIEAALEGNIAAFKEIADRVDGKAAQSLDLAGEVSLPVSGQVTFVSKSEK